jgi:SAM-dependent methyltransferase
MKHHAPAAERNREPILTTLATLIGDRARVLEVGSGTGQHAAFFTERMPEWQWQPTEARAEAMESIAAYRDESKATGFLSPLLLNVKTTEWPGGPYDAVFSANVVHIAPWPVSLALVAGAARTLRKGGRLILYGPFRFRGELTPESNRAFDERLRSEDPAWGIRDVIDIAKEARAAGFGEPEIVAMPANNHVVSFTKTETDA